MNESRFQLGVKKNSSIYTLKLGAIYFTHYSLSSVLITVWLQSNLIIKRKDISEAKFKKCKLMVVATGLNIKHLYFVEG